MFEYEDIDSTIAKAEADGIRVTKNDDGSVKYKMSKSRHMEMMRDLDKELIKSIDEMKNDEELASIQDITHNHSFSEFTLIEIKLLLKIALMVLRSSVLDFLGCIISSLMEPFRII